MSIKIKKGDVFTCNKDSNPKLLIIKKVKWDEEDKEHKVDYILIGNKGEGDSFNSKLVFVHKQQSLDFVRKTVATFYKECSEDNNLIKAISLANDIVRKATKHNVGNLVSYIHISEVRSYENFVHLLFIDSLTNKLIIAVPTEEDYVNFVPSNSILRVIEIGLENNTDASEESDVSKEMNITFISKKRTTLWDFLREYPNLILLSIHNKKVARFAMLWNALVLNYSKEI